MIETEHRAGVEARSESLRTNLLALDHKIDHYQGLLSGAGQTGAP